MAEEKALDFFTDADKNKAGKNSSTFPAWMHETHVEDLRESIRQREHALDNDLVIPSEKIVQKERLRAEKQKLEKIEDTKPKVEGPDLDRLAKARNYLGKEIKAAMYSREDMKTGVADAHEEARRMSTPCISITKAEDILPILKACGVDRITPDGKISRGQAEKAWKILSAFLGEQSNTEVLRKEK